MIGPTIVGRLVVALCCAAPLARSYRLPQLAPRSAAAARARPVAYMYDPNNPPQPPDLELTFEAQVFGADDTGYGPAGTLLRQGPTALINRITKPVDYELGILKFMAERRVTRREAQGNLDAVLSDPNSWLFNELQKKKDRNFKVPDYTMVNINPKSLALTAIWGLAIVALVLRVLLVGGPEWAQAHPDWTGNGARLLGRILDGSAF
ncbi:hypothetical protein KFE25_013799 [Diacronema lutheri]|uniref:Uncharacterized protein n=1 Tax=Diacronema lutheri TaxID=2081491 RepID=A0A8J5XH08_DIALT|nr:hypothetical protein KFE25_013799 [Diacronema lutheri]